MDIARALVVMLHEGKDLKAVEMNGLSDPYCKLKVNGGASMKSEVVKGSLAPVWNHRYDCGMVTDDTVLDFEIFDWERIGSHKSLGKLSVTVAALKQMILGGHKENWFKLDKSGFIRVSFEFTPALVVPSFPDGVPVPSATSLPIVSGGSILPPPVYFVPLFVPTTPAKSYAEIILPGEVYQTKLYVTGEPVNATLILHIANPLYIRRSFVSLKGKIKFRGKKNRELIHDFRDLLHGSPHGNVRLERGKHIYPFQFFIPRECNSSISLNNYSVAYVLNYNADIVNEADINISKAITVVNLEDTNYKVTQSPIQKKVDKSPLTGGNIEYSVSNLKNSFYPGEDIELTITVNNKSKKTIKKMDFSIHRIDTEGTDLTSQPTVHCVSITKEFFPKIRANDSHTQVLVVETPTNLIQSLSQAKFMTIKYNLICRLDIPKCIDLSMTIPINIVLPDPKRVYLPLPLNEVASIPRYIHDWTVRHFNSYLLFRMNCPELVNDNAFYQYHLTGEEMITLNRETLTQVLQGAGPRLQEILTALETEIHQIMGVRNFLKDNQLPNLISVFQENLITTNLLPKLDKKDLVRMNINVGDQHRILEAIKHLPH